MWWEWECGSGSVGWGMRDGYDEEGVKMSGILIR